MEKIYQVVHLYDEDGGFGDPVTCKDVIGATTDKALAEAYVRRYNKPAVYAEPYSYLYCHGLEIDEVELGLDINKNPWEDDWFSEKVEEFREKHAGDPDYDDCFDDDEDEDDAESSSDSILSAKIEGDDVSIVVKADSKEEAAKIVEEAMTNGKIFEMVEQPEEKADDLSSICNILRNMIALNNEVITLLSSITLK